MNWIKIKRLLFPPTSRREALWIEMVQLARLFLRDGVPGVVEWVRVVSQGSALLTPAWWLAIKDDCPAWKMSWDSDLPGSRGDAILYSGLPYNPDTGQRATWLARSLAKRGYRVLITGLRWSPGEEFNPPHPANGITQAPLDSFWRNASQIFSQPADQRSRLLILEFSHPSLFNLINLAGLQGWTTIYDCIDDWQEFHRVGQAAWYDSPFETYIACQADFLTATSPVLGKSIADRTHRPVALLPNAYDPEGLFPQEVSQSREKGQISLGYFGHLTQAWFDWPRIIRIANARPEWQFHLVGDLPEGSPVNLPANIKTHGRVPHDQLASITANWDVALIPFLEIPLSKAVDPIKIYEYLALRLPVVTTGMPHLVDIPAVNNVTSDDEFITAVEQARNRAFPQAQVTAYLAGQTWDQRTEDLIQLVKGEMHAAG